MVNPSQVIKILSKELLLQDVTEDSANLSLIVHHLIDNVKTDHTEHFERFFEQVEHFIIFGSPEVQHTLIVGLLEELKNLSSIDDLDYAVFENWLGPESHVAWRWLEKKWQGTTSLADAVRKNSLQR